MTTDDKKLYWDIDKVFPWKDNPRKSTDEDFSRLKNQIKELGEYKPLLITDAGEIIGGNMRFRAYQELGYKKVWVSVVSPKTHAEKLRYALSDNDRIGSYIEDDLKRLVGDLELEDLKQEFHDYKIDLGEPVSFDSIFAGDAADEAQKEAEEDETAVDKTPAVSQLGTVYQLGKHRLMCGDSTDLVQVQALLNGEQADVVFTDPPYNVGYEYATYNDNLSYLEYKEFCEKWLRVLQKVSNFICITPGTVNLAMWGQIEPWKSIAPWIKMNTMNSGEISFLRLWEPLIFYGKPKTRRNNDLFQYPLIIVKDMEHTCPKPIDLIVDILKSYEATNVLDIFGGSGSTLLAAEKIGIPAFLMELDPKYCDVIRRRYAKFIGQEAEWEKITPEVV